MNKGLILFKTSLINSYKLKKQNSKKTIFFGLLVCFIVFYLMFSLSLFLKDLYDSFHEMGLDNYYLLFLMAMVTLFVAFFTIFSAKSSLYENKDNSLLLSLPIKRKTIFLNRFIHLSIYNFALSLLFLIPGLYLYFNNVSVTGITGISIIVVALTIAIIPTIIASLFGWLVAFISSRAKNKSRVELISYIIFIAAYLLLFMNGNNIINELINNIALMENLIKYIFFPIYLFNEYLINNNLLYILAYLILNVAVLYLFITILSKSYFNIISKLSNQKTKGNYKLSTINQISPKKALLKQQLNQYFGSAIYVFNTAFGVVFLLIGAVASFFASPEKLLKIVDMGINLNSFMLVLAFTLFVVCFTVTTNSAISIEKKSFWILKSLPISIKDIFTSKVNVNKIILIPGLIIGLILFIISGYINIVEGLLIIILGIILNDAIAYYGLICNLLFPKLNAPNDTVIVKQSMSSMMGILVPFVLIIALIIVIFTINISHLYLITLLICGSIVLSIIMRYIVNKWGVKKYKLINYEE